MGSTTIYVKLLDEGTDVWTPVAAEHLGHDKYRIIQDLNDDLHAEFSKGKIVRCEMKNLSDGEFPVAIQESKLE